MISPAKTGGGWQVIVYDPAVQRKRYIGTYRSPEDATTVEAATKARFRGEADDGSVKRCPGCRRYFVPDDEWHKRCSPRCEANVKRRQKRRVERTDDHWVYTAINANGEVIYVGVTSTGLRRHREHGRWSVWWPEVANIRVAHYPTRAEALAAEIDGIALYKPRFNTLGIPNG